VLGSPPGESGRQTFESAPHLVEIAKPFAVGRYAVTFAQWDACYAEGACGHRRLGDLDFGRGKRPAIFATWAEAQLYVQWLKRKTGQPYRLLSEAEWEYAARGCRNLKCAYAPFWFGAIKPELAVYDSRRSYDGSPKATICSATCGNGPRTAGTRLRPPSPRMARPFFPAIARRARRAAAHGPTNRQSCARPRAIMRASMRDQRGSGSASRGTWAPERNLKTRSET
jgi:hypothetical protein